ncbi:hypothetical protein JR316_0000382 [Psilocybe cubensis]|uniref:Uncharacterized protein n=2 Tax=Psilocybe cubensis TaxID=181762 RepID=A0ACB8HE76_PSICU|nr:hypothetical protein JR316_0000382 [Psilocybe cubensis]KAH9486318.1 hypothetical protein JR316_0000382 [Psilocybe cubensis]
MTDQQAWASLDLHKGTKRGELKNKFCKFQHYRLVFQELAKSLEEFKDVKELLIVISDVIQAHHDAYEKAHILHRDISAGNIMINQNGRGLLIDWDLSKAINTHDDGTHQPERTGTWQFIAYNQGGKHEPEYPILIHSKDDDLESFFHVLYWIALRCCGHGMTIDELRAILEHNYDLAVPMGDKPVVPEGRKVLQNSRTIPNARFKSPAIDAFLEQFHNIVSQRYILQEKHKNLLISWKDEILKANPEGLANDEIVLELEAPDKGK